MPEPRDICASSCQTKIKQKEQKECVGNFGYSMYGTRGAAHNWPAECSTRLIETRFQQGKASPCTFYRKAKGMKTIVHGDDYVSAGHPRQLQWLYEPLKFKYKI